MYSILRTLPHSGHRPMGRSRDICYGKEESLEFGLFQLGKRVIKRQEKGGEREGGHTVSQMTTWESTGKPVQPAYCSSPNDLTIMGLSSVPVTIISNRTFQNLFQPCSRTFELL